jgi:hypothetical protein
MGCIVAGFACEFDTILENGYIGMPFETYTSA